MHKSNRNDASLPSPRRSASLPAPSLRCACIKSPRLASPHLTSPLLSSACRTTTSICQCEALMRRAIETTRHCPPLAGPHPSRVTPSARGLPSPPPPPKVGSTKKCLALGPVPPIQLHTTDAGQLIRHLRAHLTVLTASETTSTREAAGAAPAAGGSSCEVCFCLIRLLTSRFVSVVAINVIVFLPRLPNRRTAAWSVAPCILTAGAL